MYLALIGDLIASKKIDERQAVQEKLAAIFNELNQCYSEDFASPLTLTLGDEFQVLLKNGERVFELIDKIKFMLAPVEVRFGLGLGAITTYINPLTSLGADGPAYWHARAAIEQVHREGDPALCRVLLVSEVEELPLTLINQSLRLCDFIESRWRKTQRELLELSVLEYGHDTTVPQKVLAEKLGISTQAINQRIQSSGYYQLLTMKNNLADTIAQQMEGTDG